MLFHEPPHVRRFMVGCMINKKNEPFEFFSLRMGTEIGEMLTEFDIPSTGKTIPYNALLWPEQAHKAIDAVIVAKCRDLEYTALGKPAAFCLRQQLYPFFILKGKSDSFFKRAAATFLYRRSSSRLR